MKKLIVVLMVLVFSASLAACEKSDAQKEKEQKGSMGKAPTGKNW